MAGKYDHLYSQRLTKDAVDRMKEVLAKADVPVDPEWPFSFIKRKRAATGVGAARRARAQLFPDGVVPDQIALPNPELIELAREQLKKMGLLRAPRRGHRGRSISDSSILRGFGRKR
jgi:hypothetical protein